MATKAFFIVPILLGILVSLAVGFGSGWSTDLWALPLIIGVFLGVSLGLAARRLESGVSTTKATLSRQQNTVEVIILVILVVTIVLPVSAQRTVQFGGTEISVRTLLEAGATLIGLNLLRKLVKAYR